MSEQAAEAHMSCEVIARPCCIGIYGQCHITTKEYCDFVQGFFHEEAALCSQVSCLDDVCGMIPFYNPEVPDQFYRLWTSLFLHAGIIHLLVTVIVQYLIMRDVEKLIGPLRMAIIYIMSGVAGNLASAIFVPYRAEVGPAGSQFGLLACLFVEVIHCWQMLKRPGAALLQLGGVTMVLFLIGLLPWVDNYAHLFGFIFGFLMSYALLPFVSFGTYDRTTKIILIWVCLIVVTALFVGLIVLFYVHPIYECSFCKYFNCIPLTRDFCENQDINFTRQEY
ncbi:inactive rhomboid protein 1-like [Centruroides sculpturatus]|nr:inactive rhomboid protein 1-like [Centruroides sculpturatus]